MPAVHSLSCSLWHTSFDDCFAHVVETIGSHREFCPFCDRSEWAEFVSKLIKDDSPGIDPARIYASQVPPAVQQAAGSSLPAPMYDLNSGGMGHIAACVRSRAAASTADGRSVDNLRMPLDADVVASSSSTEAHQPNPNSDDTHYFRLPCFFGGRCQHAPRRDVRQKTKSVREHLERFHLPISRDKSGRLQCEWRDDKTSHCEATFKGLPALAKHVATVHYRLFAVNCPTCRKGFSRKDPFVRHVKEGRCKGEPGRRTAVLKSPRAS